MVSGGLQEDVSVCPYVDLSSDATGTQRYGSLNCLRVGVASNFPARSEMQVEFRLYWSVPGLPGGVGNGEWGLDWRGWVGYA